MTSDQFTTDYRIAGPTLDVDRFLRKARLRSKFEVWRPGDPTEFGLPHHDSGIRLRIFAGGRLRALHRAVERFVIREVLLLKAVRRVEGRGVASSLTTAMFVEGPKRPGLPSGLSIDLPPDLTKAIGAFGITWTVEAWSCLPGGGLWIGETGQQRDAARSGVKRLRGPRR